MTHSSVARLKTITLALIMAVSLITATARPVMAAITNPGVGAGLGDDAAAASDGSIFASYFITLWQGVIAIGGIMILIFFLWGAIEWITAGGDSGKVTKARDRITQSLVGFIILVSTAAIIAFIGQLFFGDSLDLFNLTIPNAGAPDGSGGGPGGGGGPLVDPN